MWQYIITTNHKKIYYTEELKRLSYFFPHLMHNGIELHDKMLLPIIVNYMMYVHSFFHI